MISLYREYSAIDEKYDDIEFLCEANSDYTIIDFRKHFQKSGWNTLSFDSESEVIVYLDDKFKRQHFINQIDHDNDEIVYIDGTVYIKFFATIKRG